MTIDLKHLSKADADMELGFWFERLGHYAAFNMNLVAGGSVYTEGYKQQRRRAMGRSS